MNSKKLLRSSSCGSVARKYDPSIKSLKSIKWKIPTVNTHLNVQYKVYC